MGNANIVKQQLNLASLMSRNNPTVQEQLKLASQQLDQIFIKSSSNTAAATPWQRAGAAAMAKTRVKMQQQRHGKGRKIQVASAIRGLQRMFIVFVS